MTDHALAGQIDATGGLLFSTLNARMALGGTIAAQSLLTALLLDGQCDAISTLSGTLSSYPLCDIRNGDDLQIDGISFESTYAGLTTAKQQFTIRNNSTETLELNLTSEAISVPVGSALDTYLSTYFSADDITYARSIPITISPNDTEDFYIYYQPPSTAKIGDKEWQTDLGITPVPNVTLLEDWFYVAPIEIVGGASTETDCPVIVELPYQTGLMSTFADLRFCLADGTELDWGISERTLSTSLKAVITIPTLPATPITTMICAYGANALATQGYQSELGDYGFADGTLLPWTHILNGPGCTVDYNITASRNMVGLRTYPTRPDDWEIALGRGAYGANGEFKYTFFGGCYPSFNNQVDIIFKPFSKTNAPSGDGYALKIYFTDWQSAPTFNIIKNDGGVQTTLASAVPTTWTGTLNNIHVASFSRDANGYMEAKLSDMVVCSATDSEEFECNYMVMYRNCNPDYIIYVDVGDYTEFPSGTVTEGDWNFYLTPKTIKAGIIYRSKELPDFEPEIRHGCKIGDVLYE